MMITKKTTIFCAAPMLLLAIVACGDDVRRDAGALVQAEPASPAQRQARLGIEVGQAWSRAIPPAAPVAAGFMTIANSGTSDDRLLAVRSDAAERVEIHEVRHEDGMARMRELTAGLPLPAGTTVELKPGGYHLMFITPADGFVAGGRIRATLEFERAGTQQVEFEVRDVAAGKPAMDHSGH